MEIEHVFFFFFFFIFFYQDRNDRTRRVTSKIKLLQRIKPVRNETTATKEHDN